MKEYDAMEQAYKNGYIDGFRNGLNKLEECLQKYPIQTILKILSDKETLIQDIWEK
jgi:hypothetical protein